MKTSINFVKGILFPLSPRSGYNRAGEGKMDSRKRKEPGLWNKLFQAQEKGPARSEEFVTRSKAPTVRPPDPEFQETRRTTTAFIRDAVKQKRFVSVATKLADKGQQVDAGQLAQAALRDGKFEQAISIYEKLGNHEKLAEANYLAARDCQRKGGAQKIVISRLYAAVKSCGQTLNLGGKAERLRILRRMTVINDDLTRALEKEGDFLGAADCYLFQGVLFQSLQPYAQDTDWFSKDPEFFAAVGRKAQVNARLAHEKYRQYIDGNDVTPDSKMGKSILEKLRKVNVLLSGTRNPRR